MKGNTNTVVEAMGRSREGAWIEIFTVISQAVGVRGRSREGAWIEMPKLGTHSN